MWQRVQTLYLAISTILIAVLFFLPKAIVETSDSEIMFTNSVAYIVLLAVILVLNFIALFTYKVRILQMRTAMLSALVIVGLQIYIAVDFYFTHDEIVYRPYALFPLMSIFLNILAFRSILADQLLVESASSLRKSRRERRS